MSDFGANVSEICGIAVEVLIHGKKSFINRQTKIALGNNPVNYTLNVPVDYVRSCLI